MLDKSPLRIALACVAVIGALAITPAVAAPQRAASFGRSSMIGSGTATMQLETVPARIARVAVRPGTGGREAWALGTTTARRPGYDTSVIGQTVFLKFTRGTGWIVVGPPLDAAGKVINPVLSSFDIRRDGEGWAVGDGGVLLRKAPGSDRWVRSSQSGAVTQQTLNAVSLAPDGTGYAVGVGPTILRLAGGQWSADDVGQMAAQTTELQSVSAVSASDAWLVATGQVTGLDSTSLLVYRRGAVGWARVTTEQAIFDSPPAKSRDGAINRSAEAGVVAADARGAWIGGRIFPRSPSAPDGDAAPGDTSRAFVIRFDNAQQRFTSYCPDSYSDATNGVDLTRMCDQPFPTAPFHIASLSIVPGGDVFAGGLGLFRFSGDGWYREPNANGYLISIAMGSNTEGFVASPGRSLGAGGLIRSSSTTIGHWTANPRPSAIARWSQPQEQLLHGAALAQDGSGRAIAVGNLGAAVTYGGSAWDSINPIVGYDLHAAAWPDGSQPWAVGSFGFILRLDGLNWKVVDSPTNASLFSVAFRDRANGVAVGLGGTILVYEGGRWREDSPKGIPNDLYKVIVTPAGYLAVGKDGAVVEGRPGAWTLRSEARRLLIRPETPQAPTLYAATTHGARIVIGGQDSSLLVREPDGSLRIFEEDVQGTVMSLASSGKALYASVSPNEQKYRGEAGAAQRGTVLRYADGRWTDVGLDRRVTLLRDQVDPSRFEDPIYDLVVDAQDRGWGVGGSPADIKDSTEGHFRAQATSAVYRVAFGDDPTQPAGEAPLTAAAPGVAFAAFGESWCGTGLCSSQVGTGTMADEVALQIRDEINRAAAQPGGPKFVAFTGGMRRTGIPEELEQFKKYLAGFTIPVFAAPGVTDRFAGFEPGRGVSTPAATAGSNDYWKSIFASQMAPWGTTGKTSPTFRPVTAGGVQPIEGQARTHYAFDYMDNGVARMRVVFVDSSTRSYGTLQQQNPSEEQSAWLSAVLTEAAEVARIPAVVVTNQPPFVPSDEQIPNWSVVQDQQHFESTVAAARVTAVVTGGPRVNAVDAIRGVVPVPLIVAGGGGAPLGRDLQLQEGSATLEPASKIPTDGYYHAWHLLRVDPNDRPIPLFAQANVHHESFPVLESVAMHSFNGYQIPAGNTTFITSMTRGLNGGFSDPDQSKATYMLYGRTQNKCAFKGQGNGLCVPRSAKLPSFRFYSEDPSIADFVQRDVFDASKPAKVGRQILLDPGGAQGLLCVFKLGKVGINAVAGLHRTRLVIEGLPGNGPCVEAAVPPIVRPVEEPFFPVPTEESRQTKQYFFRTDPRNELAAVFPAPPAPIVAPAPPGAPGVGRKEEHEVETEKQGHQEGMSFTALSHERERRGAQSDAATHLLGIGILGSFVTAAAAAAWKERRSASIRSERAR